MDPSVAGGGSPLGAIFSGVGVFFALLGVVVIAGLWKVFTKADRKGWKSLIPFYNTYVLLKIVGRPGWWLLLYFIPVVNVIVAIIHMNDLSKSFGKGAGFTIGLIFLPFVFAPILGFGKAQYVGPSAASTPTDTSQPQQPPQTTR